jgi:hypothetical protein
VECRGLEGGPSLAIGWANWREGRSPSSGAARVEAAVDCRQLAKKLEVIMEISRNCYRIKRMVNVRSAVAVLTLTAWKIVRASQDYTHVNSSSFVSLRSSIGLENTANLIMYGKTS